MIELLPALVHFPANHLVDDQPVDRYSLARRRGRAERPTMCARGSPTERHQIALNQLILHREVEIGKGPQEARHELFPRADSTQWLINARDMDDAIWQERFVGGRHVATIETLNPKPLVLYQRVNRHVRRSDRRGERAAGRLTIGRAVTNVKTAGE